MMSATDPYRRFLRRMTFQVGACWVLVLLAAWWAWRVPAPADPVLATMRPTKIGTTPTSATTINTAVWSINLWRPFADEAPTAAAPAAPMALKLYSILQQDGGLTAAIAAGDNAGLVYVKAGDAVNGITVVRVEADGVILRINGQEQRLGLGP